VGVFFLNAIRYSTTVTAVRGQNVETFIYSWLW